MYIIIGEPGSVGSMFLLFRMSLLHKNIQPKYPTQKKMFVHIILFVFKPKTKMTI